MTHLGSLEGAVMERLWASEAPLTVRDVLADLDRSRPLAYTTVMTVLDNLHRKGMVAREKSGRAYAYSPTGSRADHTADLMNQALSSTQDRGSALLRFVERISADEVETLREALEDVAEPAPSGRTRKRKS